MPILTAPAQSAILASIGAVYSRTQIESAIQLLDDGGLIPDHHGYFTAVSNDGRVSYSVNPRAGTCTCYAGSYGRPCYHRAAATAYAATLSA